MVQTLDRPEQDTEEATGSRRRRLLPLVAAAAVLLVAAGIGYWLLQGSSSEAEAEEEVEEGAVVEITDLTANLGGDGFRYVRVSMAAVLAAGAEVGPVEQRFPILKDAALSELTALTAEELRTADGLNDLRARLTAHAGEIYPDGEVLRILITELVVQ